MQQRLVQQKKEENALKSEIQTFYGTEDITLEKEQKLNSLKDEITILQKKFDAAQAEEKSIQDYKEKVMGSESEVVVSIRQSKTELANLRSKYKQLTTEKSSV